MSRDGRPTTNPIAQSRAARDHPRRVRHKGRPCGTNVPVAPSNVILTFDNSERDRHDRVTATITCDEVSVTELGSPTVAREYVFELQSSADGAAWTAPKKRRVVKAKDGDDNDHAFAVFEAVRKHRFYRGRVRAISKDECQGDFSAWTTPANPNDNTAPPMPTALSLEVDEHKITFKYDGGSEGADPDLLAEDVAYFVRELATDAGFTNVIRRSRATTEHASWRITKPGNATFHARVRAVDSSRNKSAWASVSASRHTPDQPAAPTVAFDTKGTRHARYRALVTVATVADADAEITKYVVQLVHKSTQAAPTSGDRRKNGRVEGDATGDDLIEPFSGIPKNQWVYARTRAVDTQGRQSAWSAWTDAGQPSASGETPGAVTGLAKDTSVARRVRWSWDDPNDDVTTRWQVTVKQGGSPVEGPFVVRQSQHAHRIPESRKGLGHQIEVVPLDDIGTAAGAATDTGTPTATIDGDVITAGTINLTPFASTIRPVAIVATLPTLPDSNYPTGAFVFLTSDSQLYETKNGTTWVRAISASDLSGTITAGQIAAGAITSDKLAANSVIAGKIAAGAVSATEISVSQLSAISANLGTVTAGEIQAVFYRTATSGNRIEITGAFGADKIRFIDSSGNAGDIVVASGGGMRFDAAQMGFYGHAAASRPTVANLTDGTGGTANQTLEDVSGTSAAVNRNFADVAQRINAIIDALEGIGIFA